MVEPEVKGEENKEREDVGKTLCGRALEAAERINRPIIMAYLSV